MLKLKIIRKLYPFIKEHEEIERNALTTLGSFLGPRFLGPYRRSRGSLHYGQKNAFSIMFLAIYASLGMDKEKRAVYGTLSHGLRGIVTGTDNLLDDEYKEMIPLRFHSSAVKFKSVMHIMLFDRLICATLLQAAQQGIISQDSVLQVEKALLSHLAPIGAQEAIEEGGIEIIMKPERVLNEVLVHRGGNLLRLAFVAPRLMENTAQEAITLADKGVFHIGMALQIIDDLTDVYEDLAFRRHNFAVSYIYHEGEPEERKNLEEILAKRSEAEKHIDAICPKSVSGVVQFAIEEALFGFHLLERAGFWMKNGEALSLIRLLFRLRGAGRLLRFVPRHPPSVHHKALFPPLPEKSSIGGVSP